MNVKDLIEQLEDMNPDAEVMFTYNYGDYWRTSVAQSVETVGEGDVEYSAYHRMDKLVDEDHPDEDHPDEEPRTVVLLG